MSKKFLVAALFLTTFHAFAQEKRALVIAIDKYTPPPGTQIAGEARSVFRDLDGCLNDARSIQSIITSRFQFNEKNVDSLYNEAASRDAILKQMNSLLEKSKKGDVAFIYYAGHGSQVPNSLSKSEVDKKDESMVPANTWEPGVKDIRDKELAVIYNKFIDKGVKLTVILDCCHSGSLSRGPGDPGSFRFIADPNYDAKDASQPQAPELRSEGTFLIMSAAQDNEFAQEQRDENNMPHGAFTLAFIQALNQQSTDASALNLFTSIRAIIKSNGRKQEPVLGASAERQLQTLFGLAPGSVPDKSRVAISGIDKNTKKITLQGGYALGLYKENELAKIKGKDTAVIVRIDSVTGINKSIATIIKGDIKDLQAGEYLDVTNWVSSGAPVFKVYVPSGLANKDDLEKLVALSKELQQSKKIKWVKDLEKTDPYTTVFLNKNTWYINIDDGKGPRKLANLSAKTILDYCKQDSTFYFELPPSKELADSIISKLASNRNLTVTDKQDDANYALFGTLSDDGKPSYGLRRSQTSARDSLESMPAQTANFIVENYNANNYKDVADSIYDKAMRLFKIRGWLQLTGPRKEKINFPFHLELINDATNKQVGAQGSKLGDNISLHIVTDKLVSAPNFNPASIPLKYVYVFGIDKSGKMTLLYPDRKDGNVHNKFPQTDADGNIKKDELLVEYEVTEPLGTDNIFLLATDEQITTYAILFEQDGVRGATMRSAGETNPLGDILDIGKESGTRSITPKTPANWVLYKLSVKSSR